MVLQHVAYHRSAIIFLVLHLNECDYLSRLRTRQTVYGRFLTDLGITRAK